MLLVLAIAVDPACRPLCTRSIELVPQNHGTRFDSCLERGSSPSRFTHRSSPVWFHAGLNSCQFPYVLLGTLDCSRVLNEHASCALLYLSLLSRRPDHWWPDMARWMLLIAFLWGSEVCYCSHVMDKNWSLGQTERGHRRTAAVEKSEFRWNYSRFLNEAV